MFQEKGKMVVPHSMLMHLKMAKEKRGSSANAA